MSTIWSCVFQEFVENSNTKIETLKKKKRKVRQNGEGGAEAWEMQRMTALWASLKHTVFTSVSFVH